METIGERGKLFSPCCKLLRIKIDLSRCTEVTENISKLICCAPPLRRDKALKNRFLRILQFIFRSKSYFFPPPSPKWRSLVYTDRFGIILPFHGNIYKQKSGCLYPSYECMKFLVEENTNGCLICLKTAFLIISYIIFLFFKISFTCTPKFEI